MSRAPDGAYAVTACPFPHGPELIVWRGKKWEPNVRLNGTGSRLALTHAVPSPAGEKFLDGYRAALWDLDRGTELELAPRPGITPHVPAVSFEDEGRLLMVQYWNRFDAFYSTSDGTIRYRTSRTAEANEGHFRRDELRTPTIRGTSRDG